MKKFLHNHQRNHQNHQRVILSFFDIKLWFVFVLLFVLISSYDMQTEVGRCNFMDAKLHRTSRSQICQVTYTEENCIIYSSVMVIIIVMRIMLTDKVGSSPSTRLHILESRILWHSSRASHPFWNHTLKSKIPIASGRLQECVTNRRMSISSIIYMLPNCLNWCKTN